MIQDSKWVFSDNEAMPNATAAIAAGANGFSGYFDWTASIYKDWVNSPVPLWLIVEGYYATADPPVGTSIKVEAWQHTTATITSGSLIGEGPIIVTADLTNDPYDDGKVLWVVPMITLMTAARAMGGQKRYMGLVYRADGDMRKLFVNAWLHIGVNPPIYVAPPAVNDASNIVMPT